MANSSARFKITGSISGQTLSAAGGHAAEYGETLTLQLEDTPALDVQACTYSIQQITKNATAITLSNGGVASPPTAGVTVVMPGSGVMSWMVRCTIDSTFGTKVFERIVAILTTLGARKILPSERTEYDPIGGWAYAQNDEIDALTAGGGVPGSTLVIAGAGQIGGGPLSSDVTLNVGAGTDIIVGSDTVSVDSAVAPTASKIVKRGADASILSPILDSGSDTNLVLKRNGVTVLTADGGSLSTPGDIQVTGRVTCAEFGTSTGTDVVFERQNTERFRLTSSGVVVTGSLTFAGLLLATASLIGAADESAYSLTATVNKASGDDTVLKIAQVDTASPGTSRLLDLLAGPAGADRRLSVLNTGAIVVGPTGTLSLTQTQATAGAGALSEVKGQKGFTGNVGGILSFVSGEGAIPSTNLGGEMRFDTGDAVSNTSPKFSFRRGAGGEFAFFQYLSSSARLVSVGASLEVNGATALSLLGGASGMTVQSGNVINFVSTLASPQFLWKGASAVLVRTDTLIPAGACSSTYAETVPSILDTQTARTTDAACATRTIRTQAPFATATGTNRTPGALILSVPAATNAGTEGRIALELGGAERLLFTKLTGFAQLDMRVKVGNDFQLSFEDETGGSAIANALLMLGQNATGASSTGGLIAMLAGNGTTRGGDTRVGAGNGITNGGGGDLYLTGGAKAGSGAAGNISLFDTTFANGSFGSGQHVVQWRNALVAPTTNTLAGILLYVESDSLKSRGKNSLVCTVAPAGDATNPPTKVVVHRDVAKLETSSTSAVVAYTYTLPAQSAAEVDVRITAIRTDATNQDTGAAMWRRACVRRIGAGAATLVGAVETVGTDKTETGTTGIAATIAVSGNDIQVTVTSFSGATIAFTPDVQIRQVTR